MSDNKPKGNAVFAEATTGVAFLLTLSKRQCNTLLRLHAAEKLHGKPRQTATGSIREGQMDGPANINIVQVDSLSSLANRGLVFWFRNASGGAQGFGGLTRAGELCAELLIEAGLSIEATNTLSVLKRIERMAA
jgi:hypothetical protein